MHTHSHTHKRCECLLWPRSSAIIPCTSFPNGSWHYIKHNKGFHLLLFINQCASAQKGHSNTQQCVKTQPVYMKEREPPLPPPSTLQFGFRKPVSLFSQSLSGKLQTIFLFFFHSNFHSSLFLFFASKHPVDNNCQNIHLQKLDCCKKIYTFFPPQYFSSGKLVLYIKLLCWKKTSFSKQVLKYRI